MTDHDHEIAREAANSAAPEPSTKLDGTVSVLVPADVIARSRPSGHSVPIARARQRIERRHPLRNVAVALLIALVPLLGLGALIYYSMDAQQRAGLHLVCHTEQTGRATHSVCNWVPLSE